LAKVAAIHPLGRVGEPEDVAHTIAHLSNNETSGWTTGIAVYLLFIYYLLLLFIIYIFQA
jgi:NAD(P)-dependent dehydrogenase (short-subunit alcohol dehydrogenase family)